MGDATRLRQVLLNLAGNAIKFTETGGVSVIVEPGTAPGEIVFEVRDTGIGIAPQQQARIFLEFEQAEGGAGRKFGGTGLGLAISRRIVERMGGRIEVESAPGEGSTFRVAVTLPRAGGRDAPAFAAPDLARQGRADRRAAIDRSLAAGAAADALGRGGDARRCRRRPRPLAEQRFDAVLVDHALGADAAAAADRGRSATRSRGASC